jgi:hypothetical protein
MRLAMTVETRTHIPATQIAPEACSFIALESERAQGMPGAGRNPWPASKKKSWRQSPQVQPDHPAFPARWF